MTEAEWWQVEERMRKGRGGGGKRTRAVPGRPLFRPARGCPEHKQAVPSGSWVLPVALAGPRLLTDALGPKEAVSYG
jgi:hypothetical protein